MIEAIAAAIRVRQWLKNLLVFLPVFFAGTLADRLTLKSEIVAFFGFCCGSSLGYLLNDWRDRELDRAHPMKRNRPFASGALSSRGGFLIAVVLLIGLVASEIAMPWKYLICINLYLLVTISYTLHFKDLPVIELIILTFGFLLRPLGGAAAVDLPVSKWFLIVVGFGALFVGATKRLAEFLKKSERLVRAVLDEYTESFLQSLINVSMAITLMGYALWVFEIQKGGIWSEVSLLPVTLGLFRYTWHRERGEAEAPETLIFQDPMLWLSGLAGLVTLSLAIYGK